MKRFALTLLILIVAASSAMSQTVREIPSTSTHNTWTGQQDFNGVTNVNTYFSVTGNSGLGNTVGSRIIFAGGFNSPDSARIYFGDGTGWKLHFSTRSGGVDTDAITFLDTGTVSVIGDYQINGTSIFPGGDCSNATTGKVTWNNSTKRFSCATDQTNPAGTGITSLGVSGSGQTGSTQTLSKTNDTNVTLAITSAANDHNFALGWTGVLAKSRGGAGADMSSVTFPSSGTIAVSTDVPSKTHLITFPVGDDYGAALVDTQDYARVWENHFGFTFTIDAIYCTTDSGSSTINLTRNDGSPASISASNIVCTTSTATSTSFNSGENVINDTYAIGFTMVTAATSGTPKKILVTIKGHE